MRKLIRKTDEGANGILVMIILLITVMFGIIIGSTVFFAFSHATEPSQSTSYTFTHTVTVAEANATVFYVKLKAFPDGTTPAWSIIAYGTTATTYTAGATNYTYIEANNTIKLNAGFYNHGKTKHNTSCVITYNTGTYGAVNSVTTYAVTAFGLAAIIPLIIVGGIMLRSLGFMGNGKDSV